MKPVKLLAYLFLSLTIFTFERGIFYVEKTEDVFVVQAHNENTNPGTCRDFLLTEYFNLPQTTALTDFFRITDSAPTAQARTSSGFSGDNLRTFHKTKIDLTLFERFRLQYHFKLSSYFYDGYYIYHLRKLLI